MLNTSVTLNNISSNTFPWIYFVYILFYILFISLASISDWLRCFTPTLSATGNYGGCRWSAAPNPGLRGFQRNYGRRRHPPPLLLFAPPTPRLAHCSFAGARLVERRGCHLAHIRATSVNKGRQVVYLSSNLWHFLKKKRKEKRVRLFATKPSRWARLTWRSWK